MADNELITKADVKALIRSGVATETYSDQDYVCALIDDLEPADAIPIGWLNNLMNLAETSNIQLYHAIYMVTREWERWKETFDKAEAGSTRSWKHMGLTRSEIIKALRICGDERKLCDTCPLFGMVTATAPTCYEQLNLLAADMLSETPMHTYHGDVRCETCRYYLGDGCCRMDLEDECAAGGFEAWEAKRDDEQD